MPNDHVGKETYFDDKASLSCGKNVKNVETALKEQILLFQPYTGVAEV